jgi:trimethylamine:corrinoid methyltransferase-like protein
MQVLSEREIEAISDASLAILRDTGVMVHHDDMLRLFGRPGPGSTGITRSPACRRGS